MIYRKRKIFTNKSLKVIKKGSHCGKIGESGVAGWGSNHQPTPESYAIEAALSKLNYK